MAERPDVTAVGSLRADRRACVAYGLAWTPAGVLLGLLGGGPGAVPWPATLIVLLAHAAANAAAAPQRARITTLRVGQLTLHRCASAAPWCGILARPLDPRGAIPGTIPI